MVLYFGVWVRGVRCEKSIVSEGFEERGNRRIWDQLREEESSDELPLDRQGRSLEM